MKTNFFAFSSEKGKFLWKGSSLEECLLIPYENHKKDFDAITTRIKKYKTHPHDVIYESLVEDVYIDFDFAKNLQRLDIVEYDCLRTGTPIGKEIIDLINHSDLILIVSKKYWVNPNKIKIAFEVAFEDYEDKAMEYLIEGKYE